MENVNFRSSVTIDDVQKDKYLLFYLGQNLYAMEIRYIQELVHLGKITPVPGVPHHIKGIINLRGQVVVVETIHGKFGEQEGTASSDTCIVIMIRGEEQRGFIVDKVVEVRAIPENHIILPTEKQFVQTKRNIRGVSILKGQMSLIIDGEKLLRD